MIVSRSNTNTLQELQKPANSTFQTLQTSLGFSSPLNPLNLSAKILHLSGKKECRKLIKTNTRDEKFIENLRENLEIQCNISGPNKYNKNLKTIRPLTKFH